MWVGGPLACCGFIDYDGDHFFVSPLGRWCLLAMLITRNATLFNNWPTKVCGCGLRDSQGVCCCVSVGVCVNVGHCGCVCQNNSSRFLALMDSRFLMFLIAVNSVDVS